MCVGCVCMCGVYVCMCVCCKCVHMQSCVLHVCVQCVYVCKRRRDKTITCFEVCVLIHHSVRMHMCGVCMCIYVMLKHH